MLSPGRVAVGCFPTQHHTETEAFQTAGTDEQQGLRVFAPEENAFPCSTEAKSVGRRGSQIWVSPCIDRLLIHSLSGHRTHSEIVNF